MEHRTWSELEGGLAVVADSPSDVGTVELIALRPAEGERQVVDEAKVDVDLGVRGDNWSTRPNRHTADGGPDSNAQVTLMNARVAALVAVSRDRWPEAGDQLYVDFDLSEGNVPPGTRLAIGSAVVEVTDEPHNGCAKFRRRFGADASRLINSPQGKQLHLRGINTKVVVNGVIRRGDEVRKEH